MVVPDGEWEAVGRDAHAVIIERDPDTGPGHDTQRVGGGEWAGDASPPASCHGRQNEWPSS